MNWTDKQSTRLSAWCIYILAAMMIAAMVFMSSFIEVIVPLHAVSPANKHLFVFTLECCLGVGLVILFLLHQLIQQIDNDETFTERNIKNLRLISWLCFLEAVILLASGSYYYPWLFVAGVAAFVGVIVRIIKNVFCQALLIKEENDFTI